LIEYASKLPNFDVDLIRNKCSDGITAGTKDSKKGSTRQFLWEDKGLVPEAAVLRARVRRRQRAGSQPKTPPGKNLVNKNPSKDGNKEEK